MAGGYETLSGGRRCRGVACESGKSVILTFSLRYSQGNRT